jgi:cytochrome c biogenesis protein CcmG/thiol:disulfide interchange protein DsbE
VRRSRTALFISAGLAVVVVLLVAVLATRTPASEKVDDSPLIGRLAPPLRGDVVAGEGTRYDLDDQRGGFVLVNFFATWCVPCVQEHDDLQRFADAHAGPGNASVVSVVFSDEPANVRRFFARNGGSWPMLSDDDGAIATAWGVARVPESYLVSPDGTVVTKIIGGARSADLDRLLTEYRG